MGILKNYTLTALIHLLVSSIPNVILLLLLLLLCFTCIWSSNSTTLWPRKLFLSINHYYYFYLICYRLLSGGGGSLPSEARSRTDRHRFSSVSSRCCTSTVFLRLSAEQMSEHVLLKIPFTRSMTHRSFLLGRLIR